MGDIRAAGCIVKWDDGTGVIPSLVDTRISVKLLHIHDDEEEEEEEAEEEAEVGLPLRTFGFKLSSIKLAMDLVCIRVFGLINSVSKRVARRLPLSTRTTRVGP